MPSTRSFTRFSRRIENTNARQSNAHLLRSAARARVPRQPRPVARVRGLSGMASQTVAAMVTGINVTAIRLIVSQRRVSCKPGGRMVDVELSEAVSDSDNGLAHMQVVGWIWWRRKSIGRGLFCLIVAYSGRQADTVRQLRQSAPILKGLDHGGSKSTSFCGWNNGAGQRGSEQRMGGGIGLPTLTAKDVAL